MKPPAGSTSRSPGNISASRGRRAAATRRSGAREVELAVAPALAHEGRARPRVRRVVRLGLGLGGLGGGLLAHAVHLRRARASGRRREARSAIGFRPCPAPAGQRRLHGRGDGAGLPRRAADPGHRRPVRSPRLDGAGDRAGRPAGGSAGRLLPLARPLRARAAGCSLGPPVGRLRRHRGRAPAPGRRRLFVGFTDEQMLAIVAPLTEEASKGLFLFLLLWWRRAELDGVLDGIVYAGMVGIGFAFTENILYLAAAYNGTDGVGPGRHRRADRRLHPPVPGQPVRPPAVHGLHRHRRRARGHLATPVGADPGADRRLRCAVTRTRPGTPPPSAASRASWVST